ncbi:hypothetical protein SERLA73DRAFT_159960 [Serpula lacrymans var. lacrymans S7.3]|uniref:Cyclin N-terminal domain-containing protein n=2 Tax=Serpula lacrymans var. lacrymans TaxID=341189 RepID=F8PVJ4_SERL3|nr:uncharacterized protein SERLADRAFT_414994 [Serpula lacrymans var. lacrymans S7.9]EGN99811.1 hypothetical protein SERLA73DRAFT_159960 [Serpula lacrymans var. lacrymans S7.3]EGO25381.1 hypothetical protein SERLADRAFT_414994 [Serpula lacrymans var. lacrymans S7.9]
MHAVSHSLAHRGTPATRTRSRWQPYHASLQPSSSSRSSPSTSYLITPASSVSSSPPPHPSSYQDPDQLPSAPQYHPQPSRECQLRDAQKSKYALGLVDQAVRTLCDIWHPQDVPVVFLTSRPAITCPSDAIASTPQKHAIAYHPRNIQLPSPISPTTQPSPISPPPLSHLPSGPRPLRSSECPSGAQPPRGNLVPMRGFVHEVLRRSRTSGSVLQTALCYIEAIRSKVPELVCRERSGTGVQGEPELDDRIIQGEVSVDDGAASEGTSTTFINAATCLDDMMDTVRLAAQSFDMDMSSSQPGMGSSQVFPSKQKNVTPLAPLPPLPSPLLCPRRTFLASLILASKFMQDRCYSNRAWAKLSGLPPREIGRCERALGDALEWRLWVGKLPAVQPTTTSRRPISKCKSESELSFAPRPPHVERFLQQQLTLDKRLASMPWHDRNSVSLPTHGMNAGLRRHATLPAGSLFGQDNSNNMSLMGLSSWLPSPAPSFVSSMESIAGSSVSDDKTPIPPTPELSFSPASTESSSSGGDRTIQMSSFMDVPTPPPGQFASFAVQNDKVMSLAHGAYMYPTPHAMLDPLSGVPCYGPLGGSTRFEDMPCAAGNMNFHTSSWTT